MPATNIRRSLILAGLSALTLSACGFKLRGPQPLPFKTIYLGDLHNLLGGELRRQIEYSGTTTVTQNRAEAEVRLEVLRNDRNREILSLSADGSVREYDLERTLIFRVVDKAGNERLPANIVRARREYDFSDSQVLSKQREEDLLFEDMDRDIINQLVRRLAVVRP
jgi:LPS-assembly lipoprotein